MTTMNIYHINEHLDTQAIMSKSTS